VAPLAKVLALSPADALLLACAAAELLRARIALARTPAAAIVARLVAPAAPHGDAATAARVGRAVRAAAGRVPFRADCLVQVIAAERMLRRRGQVGAVTLGARREADGSFGAHIWLTCAGVTLNSGPLEGYAVILSSAPAG
jgi:hypothetical protein